jgi:hypothetical protein
MLNADEAGLARRMKANGETAATICATLGIARTTCTGAWPKAVRTSGGPRPLVSFVMTALGDLLGRCDLDPGRRSRQFERICQWFLTHNPVYAHELRRGWLWAEWPYRWGADAAAVWRSGQWQWTHQFSQNLPKSPGTLLTPPSSFGSTPRAGLSGTS